MYAEAVGLKPVIVERNEHAERAPERDVEARRGRREPRDQRQEIGEEDEAGRAPDDGEVTLGTFGAHHVARHVVEKGDERFHERAQGELVVGDDRLLDVAQLGARAQCQKGDEQDDEIDVMIASKLRHVGS